MRNKSAGSGNRRCRLLFADFRAHRRIDRWHSYLQFINLKAIAGNLSSVDLTLAADERQRVADIVAVIMLSRYAMLDVEPDFSRLGRLVATYCAGESPETLQRYGAMGWETAIGEMKIAFARHYLASRQAGPADVLPPVVDERMGKQLIAAFLRFMAFRSVSADWYAPHLDAMCLGSAPTAGA